MNRNPKRRSRRRRNTSGGWQNREAEPLNSNLKPNHRGEGREKKGEERWGKERGHSPLRALVLLGFRDRLDERVRREAGAPYEQSKVDCATFTLTFAFAFTVA